MADLRVKFGRNVVEKDLRDDISDHNRRFSEYFKVETRIFEDKKNFPVEKPLFYCHRTVEFLKLVAHLRGQEWDCLEPLAQGDSGQLWFKLALGLINKEEGIGGGAMFHSWEVRKLLVLALVQGIPESNHNLRIIFSAVSLQEIKYRITGDLHFLMPVLGLMSTSSSNPCPFCPRV